MIRVAVAFSAAIVSAFVAGFLAGAVFEVTDRIEWGD